MSSNNLVLSNAFFIKIHHVLCLFIRKHDWFAKDLPAYLFPSPVEQDTSVIDTDAVSEVCEVRKK